MLYKADSIITFLQMGKAIICPSLFNGPVTGPELESRSPKSQPGPCPSITLPQKCNKFWTTGEYEMHVLQGSIYLSHPHRWCFFKTLPKINLSLLILPQKTWSLGSFDLLYFNFSFSSHTEWTCLLSSVVLQAAVCVNGQGNWAPEK